MNKEMQSVINIISAAPHLGFNIAGIVNSPNIHNLTEMIEDHDVDTVVYAGNSSSTHIQENGEDLSKILYNLIPLKIAIIDLPTFYAHITEKIPVSIIGETWFLENLIESEKNAYEVEKRLFDFIFALLGSVLLLPFLPLIAGIILSDSKGPVFYTTNRIGQGNALVSIVKFRTMTGVDTDKPDFKTEHTVTRVGRFLRRTDIDETPQLWGVLRGDLSLIGPRSEFPALVSHYAKEVPFYNIRHMVKPGISGWAQINDYEVPREDVDVELTRRKLSYDLYYIKNRSLGLDLAIILKTIPALIFRKGAY